MNNSEENTPELLVSVDDFHKYFNEINILQIHFLEAITQYEISKKSSVQLSSQKKIFALGTIIIRKASTLLDHPFLNHLRRRQIHGLIAQIDPIIENTIMILKTKNHLHTLHIKQQYFTQYILFIIILIILILYVYYTYNTH